MGDIVLTTPVIRALKEQLDAQVDFLTKIQYVTLLEKNDNLNNIFCLNQDSNRVIKTLQLNNYDYVVDLQNNLRSLRVRSRINATSYVFKKENIKRYLLIYFGVDFLKSHVVDRYFKSVAKLNVINDNKGLDFNIGPINLDFNTNQNYISWCVGGTHNPKKLSAAQISNVVSKLKLPVALIGGKDDVEIAKQVIKNTNSKLIYDFCGQLSIEESAYLIKKSKLLLTNDTGMMHIASAFKMPIISFWGCTKPSLGFTPYKADMKSIQIISPRSKKPCSKHGKYCKFIPKGCIKEISPEEIYDSVMKLLE